MLSQPGPPRLFAAAIAVTCYFSHTATGFALPGGDAITSHVQAMQSSPQPSALIADPPALTSSTISLDQWEIPLQKMEWDTRPRPVSRAAYYRSIHTVRSRSTLSEKLIYRASRIFQRTLRKFDTAIGYYF